jgi:hypothetical protein
MRRRAPEKIGRKLGKGTVSKELESIVNKVDTLLSRLPAKLAIPNHFRSCAYGKISEQKVTTGNCQPTQAFCETVPGKIGDALRKANNLKWL